MILNPKNSKKRLRKKFSAKKWQQNWVFDFLLLDFSAFNFFWVNLFAFVLTEQLSAFWYPYGIFAKKILFCLYNVLALAKRGRNGWKNKKIIFRNL